MADEYRNVTPRDRNRSLRERLNRSAEGAAIDVSAAELEIALKDLQDLARTRLA